MKLFVWAFSSAPKAQNPKAQANGLSYDRRKTAA